MHLVGATPEAMLDRAPWKGVDGGLCILFVLCFLHDDYSLTATIGSDTIQRSARAETMVTVSSSLSLLEHWLSLERHVQYRIISALCRISSDYLRIMPAP